MNAVPKPQSDGKRQGQRSWTDAQREEQSAKLRSRQIWLKSTGPKTPEGKSASSRNARHDDYEYRQAEKAELRQIKAYLRTQKSYIDLLKLFLKQEDSVCIAVNNARIDALFFLENELIDIEREMFGGLRFYEMLALESRMKNGNIIPFSPPPRQT